MPKTRHRSAAHLREHYYLNLVANGAAAHEQLGTQADDRIADAAALLRKASFDAVATRQAAEAALFDLKAIRREAKKDIRVLKALLNDLPDIKASMAATKANETRRANRKP